MPNQIEALAALQRVDQSLRENPQAVEAGVDDDAVQPGRHRGLAAEGRPGRVVAGMICFFAFFGIALGLAMIANFLKWKP